MHAISLLLLVGLLTLWAELTPVAGQGVPPDICSLPRETGPCLALFERWYYNPRTRTCETFTYGGCRGNANNFMTLEECQRTCVHQGEAPVTRHRCPVPLNVDVMPGQFCASDASCPGNERCCKTTTGQQCVLPLQEHWGYCPKDPTKPGQATICSSECSTDNDCNKSVQRPRKRCCSFGCRRKCVVAEEEHPGVCLKKEVVQTFAPCNDTCTDDRDCPLAQKCCFTGCSRGCLDPVRKERCQLPPETGLCKGHRKRYYYSPAQKECREFMYGGCQGNSNNFETREACEEACGKISPEVCKLPSDPGLCLGYSEMYYFNSTTGTCEIFVYGLCGGNGNRFSTKLECLMVCGQLAQSKA